GDCTATAFKLDVAASSIVNIHDNTFVAKRIGNTTRAAQGFSGETFDALNTTFINNTFIVDTSFMHTDFQGGNNLKFVNTTIKKGSNPSNPWFMTAFGNTFGGGSAANEVFL